MIVGNINLKTAIFNINITIMKYKLLCAAVAIGTLFSSAKPMLTGQDVLKMMYNKYAGKWHKALTFKQTTERYRNDTLRSKQTWRESMHYPDKLRIDIEPLADNNSIIFRGDSTYRITAGQIKSASGQGNDLIFLLGGLYSYPLAQTMEKLTGLGYDVTRAHEDTWQGKPVYVIGAGQGDLKVSQLWIDKENMYLVRMIEFNKGGKEEALFDDHLKLDGGGWTETKVHFYINDKLLQVESYYDCKAVPGLDPAIFDPVHYAKLADK